VIGDDAWRDLVGWHDRTLRVLFAEHGGEQIDTPATGSSSHSTMPGRLWRARSPSSAGSPSIAGSTASLLRFGSASTPPRPRPPLRATTARECTRLARLGALAGGGEIVASVGTIEAADVEYSNPRAVELKGISAPVEVVSVDWR
jgi:hypothetical protein